MPATGPAHIPKAVRDKRFETYLLVLSRTGVVRKACKEAHLTRKDIVTARNDEENGAEFMRLEVDAMSDFNDTLLEEAINRGRDGWAEPIIHKGVQSYVRDPFTGELLLNDDFEAIPLTIIKKSDQVLIKLLEAKVPGFGNKRSINMGFGTQAPDETPGGLGGGGVPKITIEFVESDGEGHERSTGPGHAES